MDIDSTSTNIQPSRPRTGSIAHTQFYLRCQCVKLDKAKHYKDVLNNYRWAFYSNFSRSCRWKRQIYTARPNGSMGIDWKFACRWRGNLHINKDTLDCLLMRPFFSFFFTIIKRLLVKNSKLECGEKNIVSRGLKSMKAQSFPCIRLARGKFELTNQDSAGGKSFSVLTSSWNQATFVTGDGIKYPRKGINNFKNQTSWQKVKNINRFVFLSFYFGAKSSAWQLARSSSSIAR